MCLLLFFFLPCHPPFPFFFLSHLSTFSSRASVIGIHWSVPVPLASLFSILDALAATSYPAIPPCCCSTNNLRQHCTYHGTYRQAYISTSNLLFTRRRMIPQLATPSAELPRCPIRPGLRPTATMLSLPWSPNAPASWASSRASIVPSS